MTEIDTSRFECFRSASDGSMYYGMVSIMDKVTKQLVPDADKPKVEALPQADFMINYEKVRHGYGLQLFNG